MGIIEEKTKMYGVTGWIFGAVGLLGWFTQHYGNGDNSVFIAGALGALMCVIARDSFKAIGELHK